VSSLHFSPGPLPAGIILRFRRSVTMPWSHTVPYYPKYDPLSGFTRGTGPSIVTTARLVDLSRRRM